MDGVTPHFVRGAFRLLNSMEGVAQLTTLVVTCVVVKWIRFYTLRLSVRRASAALMVMFFFLVCYYFAHLEKQSITNRRRFVAYTPDQFADHVAGDVKMIQRYFWIASRKPSKYGNYRRLNRVSQALLRANRDLPGAANRTWSFVIVRSLAPSAFVLPNCRSYFFEGLFKVCENDDTLSFVVAHEMAHCLLDHTLEKESLAYFLDKLNTLVWVSSLALIRGNIRAALVPWFVSRALHYAVFLPHSRSMELEADSLALRMTAKACFDFRYSIVYFDNAVALKKRAAGTKKTKKLFSTHPTRRERVGALNRQMDAARELHKARNCPPLLPLRKNDKARVEALLNEIAQEFAK
ncbi:metalloendopeptidase OMA1, mitochondrial-like [Dermacentor andersoni]|uniref:metalloendopeptidase OMA1, mitochondrial-like n=1 Tax=Dermacentor andersoni TaxID=34620 RepID=UPI002155C753|nr:metalloendopeptidase OMA1, mitochondrial-like [Dermacentor andersoni]